MMTPIGRQHRKRSLSTYLQVAPLTLVLFFFFVVPVALVVVVSFFRYQMLVGIVPDFTLTNYVDLLTNPTTWTLYLSTIKFTLIVLAITFVLGFWIAYFLVFHVRNLLTAIGLFLVCTVPFWTSNIIRMISWRPVLGTEGLINSALIEDRRHRPAARVAALFRFLGGGRLCPPLHAVHDRADLQLDGAHRQVAARGRDRRRRDAAGAWSGTSSCRCRRPASRSARCSWSRW